MGFLYRVIILKCNLRIITTHILTTSSFILDEEKISFISRYYYYYFAFEDEMKWNEEKQQEICKFLSSSSRNYILSTPQKNTKIKKYLSNAIKKHIVFIWYNITIIFKLKKIKRVRII